MNPKKEHKDRPREEIRAMAETIVRESGGKAQVFFKFTCAYCGQRCTLAEANTLYEKGECFKCGRESTILEAGFMLMLAFDRERKGTDGQDPTVN